MLDARPALWVTYAIGVVFQRPTYRCRSRSSRPRKQRWSVPNRTTELETLSDALPAIRATLAIIQHDGETIIAQSRRALEYLDPDNLPIRTGATYTLGYAHQLEGNRAAASRAYTDVIRSSCVLWGFHLHHRGDARSGPGTGSRYRVVQGPTQLRTRRWSWLAILRAAWPAKRILAWRASATSGTTWPPQRSTAQQCLEVSRQMDSADTFVSYAVFIARLRLARR